MKIHFGICRLLEDVVNNFEHLKSFSGGEEKPFLSSGTKTLKILIIKFHRCTSWKKKFTHGGNSLIWKGNKKTLCEKLLIFMFWYGVGREKFSVGMRVESVALFFTFHAKYFQSSFQSSFLVYMTRFNLTSPSTILPWHPKGFTRQF